MIYFDKISLQKWKENNIKEITCKIIHGGCAGNKVEILEYKEDGTNTLIKQEDLIVYIDSKNQSLFENARLSYLKGKWILVSDKINTRCDCGTSFSLSSGNKIQDKIERIRLAIKTKKEGIHK